MAHVTVSKFCCIGRGVTIRLCVAVHMEVFVVKVCTAYMDRLIKSQQFIMSNLIYNSIICSLIHWTIMQNSILPFSTLALLYCINIFYWILCLQGKGKTSLPVSLTPTQYLDLFLLSDPVPNL